MMLSFGLILVDVLIKPASLAANDGASYFGVYLSTVVPYGLSIITLSYLYWYIATRLKRQNQISKILFWPFIILPFLLIGLLLTPYDYLGDLHLFFGSVLFSTQLLLSIWLSIFVFNRWYLMLLSLTELVTGILLFYYLPTAHGLSLQMQAIYQVSFMAILIIVFNLDSQSDSLHKLI